MSEFPAFARDKYSEELHPDWHPELTAGCRDCDLLLLLTINLKATVCI